MGKPRLIILVRHAQSEGNQNREVHQVVPDHRVKLTPDGHLQAQDAGHRLRHLLRPDDTLQIFTSPYRRTRETTEGILKTLTAQDSPNDAPSPFSRHKIKVYEEPRLREQDFGNFQPCSAEMERMWRERADYGHFFYRIPNGESAADAYDRVSGFNESLWRQFGEDDFPSVLVLVTHGLMTRTFLMKWYHWSVEYFEDLRNIGHCEFVVMKKNKDSGKYMLETELRTWSELKRQRRAEEARSNPSRRNTLSAFLQEPLEKRSPSIPPRKWGGCPEGCTHEHQYEQEKSKAAEQQRLTLPPAATNGTAIQSETDDHPLAAQEAKATHIDGALDTPEPVESFDRARLDTATPHESPSRRDSYFPANVPPMSNATAHTGRLSAMASAMRQAPSRRATYEDIERWSHESGMGKGTRADALGDDSTTVAEIESAEEADKGVMGSVY